MRKSLEIMESLVKKEPGRQTGRETWEQNYVGRIYEGLGEGGKALLLYEVAGNNGDPGEERSGKNRLAERPGSEPKQRWQNIRKSG